MLFTRARVLSGVLLSLLPVLAVAAYSGEEAGIVEGYPDTAHLDRETKVAIRELTEEGLMQGHPDGTFRPDELVNRAEFIKIISTMLEEDLTLERDCFPDVPRAAWYTPSVCHAKLLGMVHGNDLPGLTPEQYPFIPSRNVNYAEASKILIKLFSFSYQPRGDWYVGYIEAANIRDLGLSGKRPDSGLTRAEIAVMVAKFYDKNEAFIRQFVREEKGAHKTLKRPTWWLEQRSSSSRSSSSARPQSSSSSSSSSPSTSSGSSSMSASSASGSVSSSYFPY